MIDADSGHPLVWLTRPAVRHDQTSISSPPEALIATLHVITASQRRGAEVSAVDLAVALSGDAALELAPEDASPLGSSGAASERPVSAAEPLTPQRAAGRGRAEGSADVARVVALTPGPGGNELGVTILGERPYAPSTLRALRRAAADADVVVAHGSKTLPACALALAVGPRRAPFVYRSIGDPLVWSGQGLRRRRTALLLRRAAVVVTHWPGAADVLAHVHGVDPEKLTVIPNGVPAARCPVPDAAAQARARAALGLPADGPVVTYLGALSPEKDVATAISAVARLDDVHLLVAGDGPDRHDLETLAHDILPGRIHFAGALPGPQEALAAGDVVILTSRTEGMPGVLIEAGLSARPVVASDVGGVASIVRPGETGMLATPGDVDGFAAGLRKVLDNRTDMGEAARRHCLANFEIAIVAEQWRDLLAQVAP